MKAFDVEVHEINNFINVNISIVDLHMHQMIAQTHKVAHTVYQFFRRPTYSYCIYLMRTPPSNCATL